MGWYALNTPTRLLARHDHSSLPCLNMSKTQYSLAAILVATVLCGPNLSQGQQSTAQEDDVFWINLPSSPLTIGLDRNRRHLEVRNHSSGVVMGYQLGCASY